MVIRQLLSRAFDAFRRRLRTDKQSVDETEVAMALFIGGPWHLQWVEYRVGQGFFICHPGEYYEAELGIIGEISETVFIWSELHPSETLDIVIDLLADAT